MHSHSQMHTPTMVQTGQVILRDHYEHVTIYRDDERIADLQARIASTTSATVGRDAQDVRGDSSPNYFVMVINAQYARDGVVVQGDEVWTTTRRCRVIAVEKYEHDAQVTLRHIQ